MVHLTSVLFIWVGTHVGGQLTGPCPMSRHMSPLSTCPSSAVFGHHAQAHHFWLIRTQKSLNKFTLCQEFYSTHIVKIWIFILSTVQDIGDDIGEDFVIVNWFPLSQRSLSVSPHLDLTCLKTLFTMTRQVPGFYLATFRYLELSDFNTADNHLVLCNNIFPAPRPPFKYFLGLVSINTSLSSLSSKRLEFFHYRCYLSASIDISMMTLEVIIILFINGQ